MAKTNQAPAGRQNGSHLRTHLSPLRGLDLFQFRYPQLKLRAIFGRRLAAVKDNLKTKNPAPFMERGLNFLFERTHVRCYASGLAAAGIWEGLPHR